MKIVKHEWKKTRIIYWSSELYDDFDEIGLSRPSLPKNYNYERNNHFANFWSGILYFGIVRPILAAFCFFSGIKVKGKKNIKSLRHKGYFIYSNHVSISDAFKIQALIYPFKRTNAIGYTDSLTVPIIGKAMKGLGLIPLPLKDDVENMKKFTNSFSYFLKKKERIIIFPEAHIWPYYTKIRTFRKGSFLFPAMNNAPIVPMCTVFRKPLIGKKPKQTILIGKPIYPLSDLSVLENKEYLYEACLSTLKALSSSVKQYEYITYIYKEKDNN